MFSIPKLLNFIEKINYSDSMYSKSFSFVYLTVCKSPLLSNDMFSYKEKICRLIQDPTQLADHISSKKNV